MRNDSVRSSLPFLFPHIFGRGPISQSANIEPTLRQQPGNCRSFESKKLDGGPRRLLGLVHGPGHYEMPQTLQWHRGEGMGIQKKLNREKQISNSISSVLKPEVQAGIKYKRDFFKQQFYGGKLPGTLPLQFLEAKDLRDLPFPSKNIMTEESFLTPIITPPPRGGFVTVLGFGKPGESPVLTQPGLTIPAAYYLGDENNCACEK